MPTILQIRHGQSAIVGHCFMELCSLLDRWPVELISSASEGRNLRVVSAQPSGSLLLASTCAGFVVHHTARSRWCHNCLRFSSREEAELVYCCAQCTVPHYCSERCYMMDGPRHALECGVFRAMHQSKLKKEVISLVIYLCSIITKLTHCSEGTGEVATPVTLEHILAMQMDTTITAGSRRHQKHKLAAVHFVKQHTLLHNFDAVTMLQLLSSLPLNEFGLWGDGTFNGSCGSILFPAAALINHSCVPNCVLRMEDGIMKVYALFDLPAGALLYQSYIDLRLPSDERKQMIQQSWQFTCRCDRCVDDTVETVRKFDAMLCVCGAVLMRGIKGGEECICNDYNRVM